MEPKLRDVIGAATLTLVLFALVGIIFFATLQGA